METSEGTLRLKEEFKQHLQEIYGKMLDKHNIKYGDIDPHTLMIMQAAEDKLAEIVDRWILTLKED